MTLIVFYLFIKKVMSFKLCVWKEEIKYKFLCWKLKIKFIWKVIQKPRPTKNFTFFTLLNRNNAVKAFTVISLVFNLKNNVYSMKRNSYTIFNFMNFKKF